MASLLNIATSGLLAYQRALNTTGHNVANANTEGYSRQSVLLETRLPTLSGSGWVGSGVTVATIQRSYDDFLAKQVRYSQSASTKMETIYSHAARIDNLLADPVVGLDPAIQQFFDAMQGVANEPSSLAARQVVLAEGQSLVDRFKYLSRQYEDLRQDVNGQLGFAVEEVSSIAQSIAQVNEEILRAVGVTGGDVPPDLLDKRETLLNQLSKKVDISTVLQDDNTLNVFVGNGQSLVIGTSSSKAILLDNPVNPATPNVAIQTGAAIQVVTGHISGGEIGGLLQFRSEFLEKGQNQLGLVALGMSERLNAQHELGLDLYGNMGGPLFADLTFQGIANGNNVGAGSVDISFDPANVADLTSSDYELVYNGGTSYTLTRLSDNTQTAIDTSLPVPAIDGFDLAITTGTLQPGDSFLVRPTHFAAREMAFLASDPNRVAAAGVLRAAEATDANGNPVNGGDASIGGFSYDSTTGLPLAAPITLQFTNDADGLGNPGFTILNGPAAPNDYLLYDPATADAFGKAFPESTNPTQFSGFGGISFTIQGTPQVGDQFVIANNTNATADNTNALALAELQMERVMSGGSATFQDTYSQLVSDVGSQTHYAEVNYLSQEGLLKSHMKSLSAISGVNLDEEAANLIKYQQAYQATAQVITVAGTLFDTLIGAVRR